MSEANTAKGGKPLGSFLRLSSVFALGLPLAVVTNIVLARTLPTAEFGRYGLAIAFASVLSIPIVSGMPMLLLREVSGYAAEGQWARYRALMRTAWGWVIAFSLLALGGFFVYIGLTGAQTVHGMAPGTLLKSLLIVPALGGITISGSALRGFGFAASAAIPQQIVLQLMLIVGYLVLAWVGEVSAGAALWWYLVANALTMVMLIVLLRLRSPVNRGVRSTDFTDRRSWMSAYVPFMAIGAVGILTTNLAILLMGYFGLEEGVAHLRVAERGAQLVTFPLITLNTVIGPRIVAHWKCSDIEGLKHLAQSSTRMLLLAAAPIALVLILFGRPILGMTFGADYAATAYWPMVILVAAQLAFSALGSAGPILAMTGNERIIVVAQVVGLIMLISIGLVLIPRYEAIGAAIAAAAGMLTMKILLVAIVWRRLSFWSGIA